MKSVYYFLSIFARLTDLKKAVFHRWKWYNQYTKNGQITEDIWFYNILGRDGGFRGL